MYKKVVTMKIFPKLSYYTLLRALFSLNVEIINKNTEVGILHGSEMALFVFYILYAE